MTLADAADEQMLRLLTGHFVAQAIYCAAELEIADRLVDGPKSVEELAHASRCSAPHLRRLLVALSSIGVFVKNEDKYGLTPLSDSIRRGRPGSLWPAASWFGAEMYRALGTLLPTVKSGASCGDRNVGKEMWQDLLGDSRRSDVFDAMVAAVCARETKALVTVYDFSRFDTVVDVGGGVGSVLAAILGAYPSVAGILFDLPEVVSRAARRPHLAQLRDRCIFEGGDFFRGVPSHGDAYVLRHVLHDWADDDARRILRTCRSVMAPGAYLLIVESPIGDSNMPGASKWSDLGLMTTFGGKERTRTEYQELIAAADFRFRREIPVVAEACVMECSPG